MSRTRGHFVTSVGTTACSMVLAIVMGILVKSQAQEIALLPPVEISRTSSNELAELTKRVRDLEATLAALPYGAVSSPKNQVQSAEFCKQDAPHSPSNGLASLTESFFSEDGRIDVGGYVKADFIHDFDAIGSTDFFDTLTIPTDGRPGQNTRFHARQTRLNLDFHPNSNSDDLRLFVEGDFFGSGTTFRLRHAFVRVGGVLAGQTWSTFMDESILPRTLDFESPRSVIIDRRGLIRWTKPVTESLDVAVALEDPQPIFDVDLAPAGDNERAAPDLIGRFRFEHGCGHLQGAGLVRMLRYRQASGAKDDVAGWGFNFTGRVNPRDFDSVLFQVAFGDGFASYRQAPDAAVDANGVLEVIPVIAWVVGYEIDWTDRISSTFVYSAGRGTNTSFQLADAPQATEYAAANIIFEPRPRLSWGVEYLYGTRTDKDDAKGEAHRVQFSVQYDLP